MEVFLLSTYLIVKAIVRVYNINMKNINAQKLGKIKSKRKTKTSAENGRKANEIRARLTVYGHEDMTDKEFKFFKKWIKEIVGHTATYKRGELSKIFRQTIYKNWDK